MRCYNAISNRCSDEEFAAKEPRLQGIGEVIDREGSLSPASVSSASPVNAAAEAALEKERAAREEAEPSPATHAILTDLKAGESVFQTLLLTKTVVQRSTTTVSCTILASKHCLRRFSPRL